MNDAPARIQLALISHTNVGKTTLARTLVGMDVGEVRDAAHVTTQSQSHTVLSTPGGDALLLWDTPGFGDSVRLMKRLALSGNPIGWFLREVVDRYRDRSFWLSQQAVRTARDSADVVLYLVNSAEDPRDTGYLPPEMAILAWLDRPVVVLLNQTGPPRPFAEEQAEQARWTSCLAAYPIVKRVLALDAFARCWVHERVFYETVGELVPAPRKEAYGRLFTVWERENQARLRRSAVLIARQIVDAAGDREAIETGHGAVVGNVLKMMGLGKRRDQRRQDKAMVALTLRANTRIAATTAGLLELYRLDPGAASKIHERVQRGFVVRAPVDARQAGLVGAVVSSAVSGLAADLMSGGLTLGAGALVGGIVGAITFAGGAWAFNQTSDRTEPTVRFSDAFLAAMVVDGLLRYLAVAHFGRGRGGFVEGEAPAFWQREVEGVITLHGDPLDQTLRLARSSSSAEVAGEALAALLMAIVSSVLVNLYPAAGLAQGIDQT